MLTCLCRIFIFVYLVVPHFCLHNWFRRPSIRKLFFVSFTFAVLLFAMMLSSITLTKRQSDHHSGITDELPGGEKRCVCSIRWKLEKQQGRKLMIFEVSSVVRLESKISCLCKSWMKKVFRAAKKKKMELQKCCNLLVYVCPGWILELDGRVQAFIQNQRL